MNIKELIHKRVLVASKEGALFSKQSLSIEELLVMEISPSGTYIKVRDQNGKRYWKLTSDIHIIEVLNLINDLQKE